MFDRIHRLSLSLIVLVALAAPLSAQPYFSIDFQSPSGFSPGDVLRPGPVVVIPAAFFGVAPSPTTGRVELDALSYGVDPAVVPGSAPALYFSVDEWATGRPAGFPPDVWTEGALGNREASADLFYGGFLPALPPPAGCAAVFGNNAVFDGDGVFPHGGPGVGLLEPNPPGFGLPDTGDNLDAVTLRVKSSLPVYFSLDARFPDPLEPFPANSGTADFNGYSGADVLVRTPAGPAVFAPAAALGLDKVDDDLDALILAENGNGVFDPSVAFYDWLGGGTDMLLFSVRRGSRIIGTTDSFLGIGIEEGDILAPPLVAGGAPAIFVPAEALGLATRRCGLSKYGDDIDALSIR